MQRLRDNLLAGAVLAGDQDVRFRGTDATEELDDGAHRGGGRDELRCALCGAQHAVLGFQPAGARMGPVELGLSS